MILLFIISQNTIHFNIFFPFFFFKSMFLSNFILQHLVYCRLGFIINCGLLYTWFVPPHTFICDYNYFPTIWYVKIRLIFFSSSHIQVYRNFHRNFGRVSPISEGPKLSIYTLFTFLISYIS
jgi:hypothetical protein